MLLSQKLAGFTKGEADVLRKAMGKKQIAVLAKMKPKFITQASEKGHDAQKLERYGQTGRSLPLMRSINRTPPAMRGWGTKLPT